MSFPWISVKNELPTEDDIQKNKRILVFSPCYKLDSLKYRLIDAQFVKICTDATQRIGAMSRSLSKNLS